MNGFVGRQATVGAFRSEVDGVSDAAWNGAIRAFDDGHYEQASGLGTRRIASRASSLLLSEEGVAVAGARLAIITLPACKTGLAFLRYGPFWRRRDRAPELSTYRSAIAALVDEYCHRRGHCLTIMPRPHPEFHRVECEVLEGHGFTVRRTTTDPNRYLVDVSLDHDAQMQSLEQKWRYNLRRALETGLAIRLCESESDREAFRTLHANMIERKKFSGPSPDDVLETDGVDAALRPRLVLALRDGLPVAGAMVGIYGDTAYYMFGASSADALTQRAGYALQWWIVRWLSGQGVRWYDLGGEVGEQGLRQFKKGLVGRRGAIVVTQGEYDRWTHLPGRLAADVIYGLRAARQHLRHWWLSAAFFLSFAGSEKQMRLLEIADERLPLIAAII